MAMRYWQGCCDKDAKEAEKAEGHAAFQQQDNLDYYNADAAVNSVAREDYVPTFEGSAVQHKVHF